MVIAVQSVDGVAWLVTIMVEFDLTKEVGCGNGWQRERPNHSDRLEKDNCYTDVVDYHWLASPLSDCLR